MLPLHMRMMVVIAAFFAILYALVVMASTAMGYGGFYFQLAITVGMVFLQFMVGPKIVEWSARVRYIQRNDHPVLWDMVADQARRANIPMPKVGISQMQAPNAFAFGRGQRDGRVCVSEGILQLLDERELKAVIGHEVGHLRNHDIVTMTMVSVIPMLVYRVAWHFIFMRRGRDNSVAPWVIGLVAFAVYFISNLLVLYLSRIREYYADKAAVEFGNHPSALASALYKLTYGSARVRKESLHDVEGMKAFFINDISRAGMEFKDLAQLDLDRSGTIDAAELSRIRNAQVELSSGDQMMEAMQTHPNMLKRVQHLSQLA